MRAINNPTHLKIGGDILELNTDFRNWINYSTLCLDERVAFKFKIDRLKELAFKKPLDTDLHEAFKLLLYFITCGEVLEQKGDQGKTADIVFDYTIDQQRVKSAFYRLYNFNPWNLDYFHWWDFKACLDDMLGGTIENKIQIRTLDLTQFKGTQKAKMQKLKDMHTIGRRVNKAQESYNKQLDDLLINGGSEEDFKRLLGGN